MADKYRGHVFYCMCIVGKLNFSGDMGCNNFPNMFTCYVRSMFVWYTGPLSLFTLCTLRECFNYPPEPVLVRTLTISLLHTVWSGQSLQGSHISKTDRMSVAPGRLKQNKEHSSLKVCTTGVGQFTRPAWNTALICRVTVTQDLRLRV